MKKIKLTQGKYALVDDEDYDYLNQWKWYAQKNGRDETFYAVRDTRTKTDRHLIYMHHIIAERMNITYIKGLDHTDRNGLNNQRSNLREATKSQQQWNRGLQKNNTSGYKGVQWRRDRQKWIALVCINKKRISIGTFDSKIDAARAYDKKVIELCTEFAVTNFPKENYL